MDLDQFTDDLAQPLVKYDRLPPSSLEHGDYSVSSNEETKRRKVPKLIFIVAPMIVSVTTLIIAVLSMHQAPKTVEQTKPMLRVSVLAGQSNMVGHVWISKKEGGQELNGTLEMLISTHPDQFGSIKKSLRIIIVMDSTRRCVDSLQLSRP